MSILQMVEEAFRYEQLDLAKQQIHLVTIKPKSPERKDVECDIHVFDVDTAPPYVTLSYRWGPPTPTKPIWLDDKRFVVRQNLYDFLCCYRNDASNVHFIWIGQLCISQAHMVLASAIIKSAKCHRSTANACMSSFGFFRLFDRWLNVLWPPRTSVWHVAFPNVVILPVYGWFKRYFCHHVCACSAGVLGYHGTN